MATLDARQRRRPRYRRSQLMRYRAELVQRREQGESYRDLADWLRRTHRVRVHRATVARALARWPESPDYAGEEAADA